MRIIELCVSSSPEGSRIVFTSRRDGNAEIYVMDADGTNQTNLTNNPGWDRYPSFSPNCVSEPLIASQCWSR